MMVFYSDVKKVILNEYRSFFHRKRAISYKNEKSQLYFLGKVKRIIKLFHNDFLDVSDMLKNCLDRVLKSMCKMKIYFLKTQTSITTFWSEDVVKI